MFTKITPFDIRSLPKLRLIRLLITTSLLAFITFSNSANAQPPFQTKVNNSMEFNHQLWDNLVKQHVVPINNGHSSQVDYQGMLNDRKSLKQYLSQLSGISQSAFNHWDKNEQLAFLLNAYNAWTVELILTKYPKLDSIKDLGSFFNSPWKKQFIPLFSKTRSLDDIEHKLIRGSGRYDEPRIHFAANCASIGCPALRAEAFTGKNLDAQLEDSTRLFLGDKSRNRLKNNDLEISSIFKWYKVDFERGSGTVVDFINKYRTIKLASPQIGYLDYSWDLND